MVTFCTYYIAWILGGEGRGENGDCSRSVVRTVSTGCETPQCAASWMLLLYAGDSSRWLLTPSPQFLSRGAQTFWHRARAYSYICQCHSGPFSIMKNKAYSDSECVIVKKVQCAQSCHSLQFIAVSVEIDIWNIWSSGVFTSVLFL